MKNESSITVLKKEKKQRKTNGNSDSNCFIALINETGFEVKGKGYCRQSITSWQFDNLNMCFVNTKDIIFPKAIKSWGIIAKSALFTKKIGGKRLNFVELFAKKNVNAKDQCQFMAGDFHWY